MDEDERRRHLEQWRDMAFETGLVTPLQWFWMEMSEAQKADGHTREWLEAAAQEDDTRAVGKRDQQEASWAVMRERWKDEGDR